MKEELGVKVEIDLRDAYQCQGPYVDGVAYHAIPIPSGTEPTRFEEFSAEYQKIYALVAEADKAPIYLHCTAGADRTGISTFMLLAVCGASYEDMARDYLFTNFSTHGARYIGSEFNNWWNKLDSFEGDTKAEKAKNWMISKGISAEQVEKIREIFVEGYGSSNQEDPGSQENPGSQTKLSEAPKTGDDRNLFIWIVLALTGMLGMCGTAVFCRNWRSDK